MFLLYGQTEMSGALAITAQRSRRRLSQRQQRPTNAPLSGRHAPLEPSVPIVASQKVGHAEAKPGMPTYNARLGEDSTSWDSRHAAELLVLAFAPTGDSLQATSPNRPRHYSQASGYPCMPVYTVFLMRGRLY